ncbi:DUF881 domain-containing protein [Oerskovia turbata]|uniref:DUF881 domain-containing protein n=1 Tax=Oerskovia turbata TaxID=1713 RepID=A0A4Q1KNS2_9CELL|nr:DUF881 domain-containing protein [Oerskovia turbata]RXR21750.1 DUF881 domain-containing protein [Oerskovia turbata]RXR31452.1 DUF881 domain-containing protein [Oerskovia turbata]TGJ95946.1 DUF881 domain-containing protein [Actinotalea fermentans ATCC 43279 = JCM 9966 = DSM 3133]
MSQDDRSDDRSLDAPHRSVRGDGGRDAPVEGDAPEVSPPPTSRGRRIRSGVTVLLVLALSGLMFTASARLARNQDGRHPQNLTDLVQNEERRVETMTGQVVALETEVTALAQELAPPEPTVPEVVVNTGIVAGSVPLTGPGLSVTLDDAPPTQQSRSASVDDLVVHQQDLQDVINALWAGGAEAMTLQGQRVTPTTAFRCVGNVLNLHGRVFSPPYVVAAVGDPAALQASLDRSPAISIYQEYVDAYGLGWKVEKSTSLDIPAFEGSTDLRYASVPGEKDQA